MGKRIGKLQRKKSKKIQRARKKYHAKDCGEDSEGTKLEENFDTCDDGYDGGTSRGDNGDSGDSNDDNNNDNTDDDDDDDEEEEEEEGIRSTSTSRSSSSINMDVNDRAFNTLEFPCTFTMKVIGVNSERFPEFVLDSIREVMGDKSTQGYSTKLHGKYCSVTTSPTFDNADQIYECYRRMKSNPDVKFVL